MGHGGGHPGAAIAADGLTKRYGELVAVDGISFEVAEGEFYGLLGPNGAGKTTTLEMVEGLRKPDAGTAHILGQPTWPRNLGLLPRIGVQLQATSFFDRLTVREQLQTFAEMYGARPGSADHSLELVGLSEKAGTRSEKLSGGQAQRLALACALVHDPQVVFLDEPTAALDPQARHNLWDVLRQVNADGRTVVLTTHYLDEAEALCDRVAIIDHGRILREDTPAALVRALDAPLRIRIDRQAIDETAARSLTGADEVRPEGDALVITTRDAAPVLSELASRRALAGLQVKGATLEDVFLELTGREYRA